MLFILSNALPLNCETQKDFIFSWPEHTALSLWLQETYDETKQKLILNKLAAHSFTNWLWQFTDFQWISPLSPTVQFSPQVCWEWNEREQLERLAICPQGMRGRRLSFSARNGQGNLRVGSGFNTLSLWGVVGLMIMSIAVLCSWGHS